MDTIFIIDAKESGKITLNYGPKMNGGKFKKGVLISQDDKVTTIFEGNAKKKKL